MENLLKDVRYSFTMMVKNPGFSLVAILTLAIGVGLCSTHFSIMNTVLFHPFSFKDSERLVVLWETNPQLSSEFRDHNVVAAANLSDWQEQNSFFEGLTAFNYSSVNLTSVDEPERINGASVSANFFDIFGLPPLLGRTFTDAEQTPGNNRVVVISHGLWQRRFGGNQAILNQPIMLNGSNYNVVGVMPQEFDLQFPTTRVVDMWIPAVNSPAVKKDRQTHYLYVVGRLKQGVNIQQAQAEMSAIANRLSEQYPDTNNGTGVRLVPLEDEVVGGIRTVLLILLGAVGLVLLIACANVANLLLTRNVSRRREIAIRTALGATRRRLIEQLLTESVILAVIGGIFGLLLAILGVDLVKSLSPERIPRIKSIALDFRVVGFTLLMSAVTAVIFGLVPALESSRTDLTESLKDSSRGSTHGKSHTKLRSFFVVFQVVLALLLLIGSSLLIRSFINLINVDPGFKPDNVLTVQLSLPSGRYAQPVQQVNFYKQVIERLKGLPRAESVGVVTALPLSENNISNGFAIVGQPAPLPGQEPEGNYRAVTPEYFNALGIQVLRGRGFTDSDDEQAAGVAVINQTMARQFFANEDPIGQHITITDGISTEREIVGVVNDIRHFGIDAQPQVEIFVPMYQKPYRFVAVAVRTQGDANLLASSIRNEVLAIDKDLPIFNVRSMNELMSRSLSPRRFSMLLLLIFAAAALVLASIGIYGVMAYAVNERSHEIGIRMALGANRGHILRMVIRQAFNFAAVGVIIGIVIGILLTRVMAGMVYGISTVDLITFVAAPILLIAIALLASYIPARRAMAVDPINVLKAE